MDSKKKSIPIFDWQFDEELRKEFAQGCERIFDEAYLTNHTFVKEFEKAFADFSNSRFCLAVSNGTAALEVVLRALNVRGKEVLLPSNTFIATAMAVLSAGGIPVILDIESDFFAMDPAALKKRIKRETGAVIVVHIGGIISPHMQKLVDLCLENQVPLVEDCAHAHGAHLNGVKAGHFGVAGCFSHFLTKVMTTGEGGSIITQSETLAQKLRSLRQFGQDLQRPLLHIEPSSNYKLSEFQALLGLLELKRLPQRLAKRRMLAHRYQKNLKGSEWKVVIPPGGGESSYYKQMILSPFPRARIESHLKSFGVALTGGVYYYPLHLQPVMAPYLGQENFPNAEKFSNQHICPPCWPELTSEDVDYISDAMLQLKE